LTDKYAVPAREEGMTASIHLKASPKHKNAASPKGRSGRGTSPGNINSCEQRNQNDDRERHTKKEQQ
jgi:hypothetical protein